MATEQTPSAGRLRRLAEELDEVGLPLDGSLHWHRLAVEEIDYALRPAVHERRAPSYGAIVEPSVDSASWGEATGLTIDRRPTGDISLRGARRFADGLVSWLIRRAGAPDEWAVFDRPAGSERDLVVLSEAMGATIAQRHPAGAVRVVGPLGVHRWEGLRWRHEPPIRTWIDTVRASCAHGDHEVVRVLLEFAVHDLGSRGIGAILIYRPDGSPSAALEQRLPSPPPLRIRRPTDLAPLRHALSQLDGAAVFDVDGVLRHLGVRLVPSPDAETGVAGYRGMRHTAGRRYSFDDGDATVIVVSEDGPVSVLRNGEILGTSPVARETST